MGPTTQQPTLVLGGTGKTGRRIVQRLQATGRPVRVGTPAATPPFDWTDEATWPAALDGVGSVYVTYYPDLAVPGAGEPKGTPWHPHRGFETVTYMIDGVFQHPSAADDQGLGGRPLLARGSFIWPRRRSRPARRPTTLPCSAGWSTVRRERRPRRLEGD
jgi:Pirin